MSDAGEDRDLLAAEYVLGVLPESAARDVARQAESDAALHASILAWQERLLPLARAVPPVPPPAGLWERIAAGLPAEQAVPGTTQDTASAASKLARARRGLRVWRGATAVSLATAAALAGLLLTRTPAPVTVAGLAPAGAAPAAFLAEARPGGKVLVRAVAAVQVPPGRDLELWALPQGATRPVSLGVLPASGSHVATAPATAPGTQLLVSLEPRGGSPTGQPTGPVVYAGTLTRLD